MDSGDIMVLKHYLMEMIKHLVDWSWTEKMQTLSTVMAFSIGNTSAAEDRHA